MAGGGVPRVRWQVVVAKAMAGGRGGDGDGGDGGSDGDGGSGGGGGADEPESRRSGHGAVRRGEGMRVPRFGAPRSRTLVHASLWFPGFLTLRCGSFFFFCVLHLFLSLQTFLHLADRKPRWCPSLTTTRWRARQRARGGVSLTVGSRVRCRRLSCTTPWVLSRRAPPGSVVPESTDRIDPGVVNTHTSGSRQSHFVAERTYDRRRGRCCRAKCQRLRWSHTRVRWEIPERGPRP